MLNRYEEERSARRLALCVVPYLSHGTFASLEIWLRGPATVNTDQPLRGGSMMPEAPRAAATLEASPLVDPDARLDR